jgi:pheromone shutdown protein TraB
MLRKKRHTFQKLSLGQVQIYLLGTAHVSNDSSQEVRLLLQQVNPDCVFVELCEARIPLLTLKEDSEAMMLSYWNNETKQGDDNKESLWNRAISLQHAAQGSMTRLQALTTVMLTTVQEEYARDLGVELGGEFQAAYRFWKSRKRVQKEKGKEENDHHHRPVHFVLGDRPVHLTLKRAWESMWWWPKAKVLVGLLWSCLVKPDPDEIRAWLQQVLNEESDILTKSFEEMRRHFPTLHRVIIAERDAYLAAKLTQTCRQLPPGSVVVAIVGAGHVRGMISWLLATNATQTPEQVIEELVSTRQRKNRAAADDPELVRHWIREVTVLQEMPHESFLWAQSQ